jgi:hypothetical protein
MGATWKPVQPTEIKDINIIREVIAQIRKPTPPEVYAWHEEMRKHLHEMMQPLDPEVRRRFGDKPVRADNE